MYTKVRFKPALFTNGYSGSLVLLVEWNPLRVWRKLDSHPTAIVTIQEVNKMISNMQAELNKYRTWFSNELAENMTKREVVAGERAILDTRMAAAMEEGKMNAWKRKGVEKKEPATVQALTKEIAANRAKMTTLVQEAAPAQRIVDTFERWDVEASAMQQWSSSNYKGAEPDHIRQQTQAELAHLRAGCVPIRFDPDHPLWTPCYRHDTERPTESWTSMSPSAYLESLNPKVEKKHEEIVPVHTGTGTPAWMHAFKQNK